MPLTEIIDRPHFRTGWWTITETTDDLYNKVSLTADEEKVFSNFSSEKRKSQWLAVRALLAELIKNGDIHLFYDDNGKPMLNNGHKISISHSDEIAAIQISTGTYCGIDVQRFSDKMPRLAAKFIHQKEAAFIPASQATAYYNLIWTLKEAIFKHFGTSVEFKNQIIIQPFSLAQHLPIHATVEYQKEAHYLILEWRQIGDYFLSYLC